jgi:hypothetical protein
VLSTAQPKSSRQTAQAQSSKKARSEKQFDLNQNTQLSVSSQAMCAVIRLVGKVVQPLGESNPGSLAIFIAIHRAWTFAMLICKTVRRSTVVGSGGNYPAAAAD